ncbi:MAG: GHMP kinase [Desulfovibrio sp.]|nr:MAG: GHMP kinase [Desulfovibrio sp.]
MDFFVPGRICLFGEHSDWAGGYRRINGELHKGLTIITGTNQGLHATVTKHSDRLVYHPSPDQGASLPPLDIPMNLDVLLEMAQQGEYYSYIAGVAYQVLTHYQVQGLEIRNHATTLPMQKGLSSSAAVSVLVARAFNRIYDLKMTVRGEMEMAYRGEITTPSRCGRMDQGCAFGSRPILMTYDGDQIDVVELRTPKDLHYVIVDLGRTKDTKKILSRLNHCYPFADDPMQEAVQHYLGPVNTRITGQAVQALQNGDTPLLGRLMTEAQAEFDAHCIPACPSELASPHLHALLEHDAIQPLVYGGKGVGSQGDGSAQFLAKDRQSQVRLMELIEKDLGLSCLELTIKASNTVRKAVIPAAGFGTRLFPATKSLKKEFFPVLGPDGRMKPVIMAIVEEAANAGVKDIGIIAQERDHDLFKQFFQTPPPIEHYNKLSQEHREYSDYVLELGKGISLITQDVQDGFGHAVFCARQWVGDESFLLMLGDHIYSTSAELSCVEQLLRVHETTGLSVVGLKPTPAEQVRLFGCASGTWRQGQDILNITRFAEKPNLDFARNHLVVEGLPQDTFFTLFGMYILTPRIFALLEDNILCNRREGGEFQLTSCLDSLRQEQGFVGCVIQGERFDVGVPDGYRRTMIEFGDSSS